MKTSRRAHLRRELRQRTRTNQAAARARRAPLIARSRIGRGPRSLVTHVIATGAAPEDVEGAATALRSVARRIGIKAEAVRSRIRRSYTGRLRPARPIWRYTVAQVARIVAAYKPRKAEYIAVKARLERSAAAASQPRYALAA